MANNYRKITVNAKQLSELYGEQFTTDFGRQTSSYVNERGRIAITYSHDLYLSWDGKPFDPGHMCLDDGTITAFLQDYFKLWLPAQVSYLCCSAKPAGSDYNARIVLSYDPDKTADECLPHTLIKIVWDACDVIHCNTIDSDLVKKMGATYECQYSSTDLMYAEQYIVVENKWFFARVAEKYWSMMGSLLNLANSRLDAFEQQKETWYKEWYKPVVIPKLKSLEGYSVEETSDSIIVTYPVRKGDKKVDEFRFGDLGWIHFTEVFLTIVMDIKKELDEKRSGLIDDYYMPSWYYATKLQDQICKNKEGTEHGK